MAIKPIIFTSVAVAAVGPMLLHGHPLRDCSPSIELCSLSDAAYLPDEPAPRRAPSLVVEPAVAGSTISAPHSAVVMFPFKVRS